MISIDDHFFFQQEMDSSLHHVILSILISLVHCSLANQHHNGTHRYDYCVLGAGPSGLQMGHFLSKAKRDYIIFERNSGPGSFFETYVAKTIDKRAFEVMRAPSPTSYYASY